MSGCLTRHHDSAALPSPFPELLPSSFDGLLLNGSDLMVRNCHEDLHFVVDLPFFNTGQPNLISSSGLDPFCSWFLSVSNAGTLSPFVLAPSFRSRLPITRQSLFPTRRLRLTLSLFLQTPPPMVSSARVSQIVSIREYNLAAQSPLSDGVQPARFGYTMSFIPLVFPKRYLFSAFPSIPRSRCFPALCGPPPSNC